MALLWIYLMWIALQWMALMWMELVWMSLLWMNHLWFSVLWKDFLCTDLLSMAIMWICLMSMAFLGMSLLIRLIVSLLCKIFYLRPLYMTYGFFWHFCFCVFWGHIWVFEFFKIILNFVLILNFICFLNLFHFQLPSVAYAQTDIHTDKHFILLTKSETKLKMHVC